MSNPIDRDLEEYLSENPELSDFGYSEVYQNGDIVGLAKGLQSMKEYDSFLEEKLGLVDDERGYTNILKGLGKAALAAGVGLAITLPVYFLNYEMGETGRSILKGLAALGVLGSAGGLVYLIEPELKSIIESESLLKASGLYFLAGPIAAFAAPLTYMTLAATESQSLMSIWTEFILPIAAGGALCAGLGTLADIISYDDESFVSAGVTAGVAAGIGGLTFLGTAGYVIYQLFNPNIYYESLTEVFGAMITLSAMTGAVAGTLAGLTYTSIRSLWTAGRWIVEEHIL